MSVPPEVEADIRRLHYAEHWPIGTIATQLHIHEDGSQPRSRETHFSCGAVKVGATHCLDPCRANSGLLRGYRTPMPDSAWW